MLLTVDNLLGYKVLVCWLTEYHTFKNLIELSLDLSNLRVFILSCALLLLFLGILFLCVYYFSVNRLRILLELIWLLNEICYEVVVFLTDRVELLSQIQQVVSINKCPFVLFTVAIHIISLQELLIENNNDFIISVSSNCSSVSKGNILSFGGV